MQPQEYQGIADVFKNVGQTIGGTLSSILGTAANVFKGTIEGVGNVLAQEETWKTLISDLGPAALELYLAREQMDLYKDLLKARQQAGQRFNQQYQASNPYQVVMQGKQPVSAPPSAPPSAASAPAMYTQPVPFYQHPLFWIVIAGSGLVIYLLLKKRR